MAKIIRARKYRTVKRTRASRPAAITHAAIWNGKSLFFPGFGKGS